ncbi:MAG: radical SAM protein [Candidatus Omnitrophica bacterium]|nr:radical SAM protein [Candidatus Omnitrophota bacterium]
MGREVCVLMVNPWIYDFACYDLFSKPIGFLKIARLLSNLGFKIRFIDCLDRFHPQMINRITDKGICGIGKYYAEEVEKPSIFKDIPRKYKRYGMPPIIFKKLLKKFKKPDIILVTSGMTYWYKGVFEVLEILKKNYPKVPIILGGIYATLCYHHALEYSRADFVFKGGDLKELLILLGKILSKDFTYDINSIYLPPYYEIYSKNEYIALRTSSGCPFKCSYCGWYLLEPKIYQHNPEDIFSEIVYFHQKLKIKNFAFYDDALLYKADTHIKIILKKILEYQLPLNFHTPNGLNACFLDEELAHLMKKTNFLQPRLGLESVSFNRQRLTGGKVNKKTIIEAVKLLKKAGYSSSDIGIYLLIGLPGQPFEEIEESIYFAHSFKARVYLEEYSPVPGTYEYNRAKLDTNLDPLWHNNSVFPLYKGEYNKFQMLKELNHKLNRKFCRKEV